MPRINYKVHKKNMYCGIEKHIAGTRELAPRVYETEDDCRVTCLRCLFAIYADWPEARKKRSENMKQQGEEK